MLLGTGLTQADLDKPQVGIASMWYEGNTCNMHLDRLAAKVREGVVAAGMVGMRFNTIGVSDGISMGTEGMSYSLPSRDVIADSIETVMHAQWYDALVAIPGCDKNMPGCLIAMGRLNRPALMVYGGTIKPGHLADGTTLDIVSAFQCYGEYVAGRIDDGRRADIVRQLGPDEAVRLKSDARLQTLSAPTERIGYMFINAQAGPTQDVRVRRAIAHAIDRKTLIDALLQGFGKEVDVVLTPANFGYVEGIGGNAYDPAKAKALLREANAVNASISFLTSPAYDRRLVEALQQMLQEVGFRVDIQTMDHPTFLRRRQGRPDEAGSISLGRWSCACQDADGVIFPLFRSGSIWAKYANPDFDKEVDAARSTLDEAKRLVHYRRAFEILREDVPGLGLYQDYAIYGARREIRWQPTANEAFFLFDMRWQP
jgi:ABC-type transport system substrate-binding protein